MCPSYARKPAMYDAKCEVYSFGVVLMELITGKLQAQMDFYEVRGGGREEGEEGRERETWGWDVRRRQLAAGKEWWVGWMDGTGLVDAQRIHALHP